MRYSPNPADFQAFTRQQAIANLKALDEEATGGDAYYSAMSNEDLEAEICMAGIVHDENMKGVFDTEREALAAVYQAKLRG